MSDGPILIDEAFGQVDIFLRYLGQTDLWSDVPSVGHLMAKSGTTTSGQLDI